MDIQIIEDNIALLEQDTTTVDNVKILASLYICRQNLNKANKSNLTAFKQDINEILPAYSKYCSAKYNFQLGVGPEECVLDNLSILCSEIKDLYTSLYSSSGSRKERKILKNCIDSLISTYNK